MRRLSTISGMRCCMFGALTLIAFFLFGTGNLFAQDNYRLPSDAVVKLEALDFDSGTSIGVPTGFVAGEERASTINVNYTGFTAPAQTAFQYAVDIWASLITSPVTIEVDAEFAPLGPTVLGSAGATTIHRNFSGAPITDTWYPQALANSLAGTDLDPGQADINASFSSSFTWYYGTDANPPAGQYDFVSVVLHELCHGLGFFGSAYVDLGLGNIEQAGDPYIYDLFVQNGGGASILSFGSGNVALANELQSNNLFWNGASAVAANGGNAPLYAPGSWDQGSSYSHLNEASYPAGNAHSLMTPQIGSAEAIHSPGAVTLGLFEDMGWQLDSGCTLLGCTDPTACNYNAAADCDDGSCVTGSWYIPTDVAAVNTPMVLVCSGDPAPAGYIFADQACAQASFDTDPYCVNTDWDSVCQNDYNFCLSGNVDCGNGQWYIPSPLNGSPMEWDCSAPAGYILADQACAQEIVNNDSYCVNNSWDSICQDAYDACLTAGCVELGCTDPAACNYSATADCEDGSCTFPQYYIPSDFSASTSEPMVQVCPGNEPAGYILADQTCAQAQVDSDPYCFNTDWDYTCVSVYNCCAGNPAGCVDQGACNFDPNACPDFSLCVFPGCTDATACNYDANAGCDDGSCILPQYYIPADYSTSFSEPMVLVCAGSEPANYILADQACAQAQVDIDPYCINTDWDYTCISVYNCCAGAPAGCAIDPGACNFDPNSCDLTGNSCTYPGCTDPLACNYNANAGCDDGSCIATGCIDPAACNYDAAAGCDDGSCVYGPSNDLCSGAISLSTNTTVTADNSNSCFNNPSPSCGYIDMQDVWYSYTSIGGGDVTFFTELNGTLTDSRVAVYESCGGIEIACNDDYFTLASRVTIPTIAGTTYYFQTGGYWDYTGTFDVTVFECGIGCTDPSACNYDAVATIESGTCEYGGCTYPAACNYDANASCDDGSCTYGGCTDTAADNYDANAGCDDSSCYFLGCTYVDAENYDATATMDDGTCTFTLGSDCPADLNNDGQVNSSDLLDFLGAFGSVCP